MAKDAPGRIVDPDNLLGGSAVIDPADIGRETGGDTNTGNSGGSDSGSGDNYARDDNGNIQYNQDGSIRKKRGRKPGSGKGGNKTGASRAKADISGIERILYSIHLMASKGLKTPELVLDNQESRMLAEAIQSVQDFYGFEASAEVMLWTNVIGVCGAVYGPRIGAIMMRRSKEKTVKARPEPQPISEVSFIREGVDVPHAAPQ